MQNGQGARRQVAERLLVQDIRWAVETVLKARHALEPWAGTLPLLMYGHVARIAHEGFKYMRHEESGHSQDPGIVDAPREHREVLERARNAIKYLDNIHPGQPTPNTGEHPVVQEMARFAEAHSHQFLDPVRPRWLWFLARDLGVTYAGGHVVLATIPTAQRLGFLPDRALEDLGPDGRDFNAEIGQVMGAILTSLGEPLPPIALGAVPQPLNLPPGRFRDVRSARFLQSRYPAIQDLPYDPIRLLLLGATAEMNAAALLLPCTGTGHEEAVFRAQVITTYHVVTMLKKLHDEGAVGVGPHADATRLVLSTPAVDRLLSEQGRRLRNNFTHYRVHPKLHRPLNLDCPHGGLVEAHMAGRTYEELRDDINTVIHDIRMMLNAY